MVLTKLLAAAAAAAAGLAAAQTSYVPATSRLHAGQRQCQTLRPRPAAGQCFCVMSFGRRRSHGLARRRAANRRGFGAPAGALGVPELRFCSGMFPGPVFRAARVFCAGDAFVWQG